MYSKLFITFSLFLGMPSVVFSAINCNINSACPTDYYSCETDISQPILVTKTRHFCIHVPNTTALSANGNRIDISKKIAAPLKLIIGFHGYNQNARDMAKNWSFHKNQDAILVFPTADSLTIDGRVFNNTWNIVSQLTPNYVSLTQYGRFSDTIFIKSLVNDLLRGSSINCSLENCVDDGKVYIAGFSLGAGMVYQLLTRSETNPLFSGAAAVSFPLTKEMISPVAYAQTPPPQGQALPIRKEVSGNLSHSLSPVPIVLIFGTEDKFNVDYDELIGELQHYTDCLDSSGNALQSIQPITLPVADALYCMYTNDRPPELRSSLQITSDWFRGSNFNNSAESFDHEKIKKQNDADLTTVIKQSYPAKANPSTSKPVLKITVVGGKHSWPRSLPNPSTDHSQDIESGEEILEFWRSHAGY